MQIEFLQSGDIRLEVCPAAGGSITKFSVGGQDILRPASKEAIEQRDPGLMSAFPMVPYCNRIANGLFWFEGRQIQLEKNFWIFLGILMNKDLHCQILQLSE